MAEPTIAELLENSDTDTVNHRGRVVRALVRFPVGDGSVVTVERLDVSDTRPQALKLAVNEGRLSVNGHDASVIALWSDTSPSTVELTVSGDATTLEIWNAWSFGGIDSAWTGNAGIVTRATDAGTILQCSDGVGPASFSDLVVQVTVRR
jgi:hypothetical protein